MRRDHPASWASTLCNFTIPAWLPPAVLLFFLTLVSAVAESAAVTPADIEQLFKDKQFIQALPVLET